MPAIRRRTSRSQRLTVLTSSLAIAATALLAASTAAADDPKPVCPPGSWFCVGGEIKVEVGVEAGTTPPPAATTELTPTPPPAPVAPPPPVVVYTPTPAPAPVYAQPAPYAPPPVYRVRPAFQSEIGANVHLLGAAMGGNDGRSGASLGGVGGSLRFRPSPWFAVDLGIDFVGGTDGNGLKRTEMPLTAVGMFYVNPRSQVQFYLLGGFGFSSASVSGQCINGVCQDDGTTSHYSYFGGLFGGGLEFRIAPKTALNFDLRGFVRERTDQGAALNPEFTARDGRTTNTSGGVLATGGLTFYF
jgi:hypothetical protein